MVWAGVDNITLNLGVCLFLPLLSLLQRPPFCLSVESVSNIS